MLSETNFIMKFLLVSMFVIGLSMSDILASSKGLQQHEVTFREKRNTESFSSPYYQQPQYPRDCTEVYNQCEGQSIDGVYLIKPEGSTEPFEVYCNNSIDGGGWTVFQRRIDGFVEFNRNWNGYKNGFGFLRRDFWLGNDKISYLTNQKKYELRIDMNNVNGQSYFAKYNLFRISDEGSKYRLVGLGDYDSTSTANNDAMAVSRNLSFTTHDRDNDNLNSDNCASRHLGGWWYHHCAHARLNSLYNAGLTDEKSIKWENLPGGRFHIKYTEMKIRPLRNS
ncbi:Fibrinogen-like protein A [Holothuria leucospilota]|uniref:Fibrinogen-like protein A n=1 Tax=Holothuria leucospilota TaxID=206669 RepID=A0A9Q0YQ18_HOLLE|nr:Fibrinogen-like protein A [Holothuria leucospilota]